MSDVTGERLEVGDDEIDLRVIDECIQLVEALCGLRNGDEILRDGALVTHAIVDVGETESVDLGDVEFISSDFAGRDRRRQRGRCVLGPRDG